jgi:hypothetical protein
MTRLFILPLWMLGALFVSAAPPPPDSQPQSEPPRTAAPRTAPPDQRATPRAPDEAGRKPTTDRDRDRDSNRERDRDQRERDRRRADDRPHRPPPRVVPPTYYGEPHRYFFPPVSLQRGFYYHPYFGFYYGPYYGPFYPVPGPFLGAMRQSVSAVRARVKPTETEVFVNGYFAGLVDDFDGIFQRLYVPPGQHDIVFRLDGYQTYRQRLYLQPGDTRDVVHQMQRLRDDEVAAPIDEPGAAHPWTPVTPTAGDRPASPFGILTLRVDPSGGAVLIDDEVWIVLNGRRDLVLHVPSGPHQLEVRRDGYQTFRTGIALSEGARTTLEVTLHPLAASTPAP